MNEEDESEGIEQVQVINHSSYYNNDMLIPVLLPKADNFCILGTNVESINAKFSELDIFVQTLREQKFEFSAICIHETLLSDKDDYSSVKLEGYKCIPQRKMCGSKGGLIIYLNEKVNYTKIQKINQSRIWEGQFINITGGGLSKSITLGNVYRPPWDRSGYYRIFIQEITPVISDCSNTNNDIIIGGDTNINLLKINECKVYSEFFDMLTSNNVHPQITLPTRFSNTRHTLIDNFF